jgi:hypothetical protein
MSYNFKRALGMSFLVYIAMFVVSLVVGVASGVEFTSLSDAPAWCWYVLAAASAILTALFALWYFKGNVVPSLKSGFLFGLTVAILSSILDFVFFSLGNMADGPQIDIGEYYGDYRFWITIVLVVLAAKLVGYLKGSKTPTPTV